MDLLTLLIFNKMKNKKGGVTPTGTINITENGETDVTNYATANVNVPSSGRAIFPTTISFSGADFANIDISWIENADTSYLRNFQNGFGSIGTSLSFPSNVDLSKWNTSSLRNMASVFYYNKLVKNIKMSGMTFLHLTDLSNFAGYSTAESIDFSNTTISGLQNMANFAYQDGYLKTFNLNGANITGVTNMSTSFYNVFQLSSLDLTSITPGDSVEMSETFRGCTALTSLDLHTFTNKISYLKSTFNGCSSLVNIIFGNDFSLEKVAGNQCFSNTFSGCSSLSNDTLNEILRVLSTATYTGTKTLSLLGLSSSQIATCQTLSNWTLAQSAGWTTGI